MGEERGRKRKQMKKDLEKRALGAWRLTMPTIRVSLTHGARNNASIAQEAR